MKHTIEILELAEQMVGQMAENGALEIERDMLLEKIRKIYAAALKVAVVEEEFEYPKQEEATVAVGAYMATEGEEPEVLEESATEPVVEAQIEEVAEEPEAELELFAEEEPAREVEEEPEPEVEEEIPVEEEQEYTLEEVTDSVEEVPAEEEQEVEAPAVSEEPAREPILSLYDDEPEEEELHATEPEDGEDVVEDDFVEVPIEQPAEEEFVEESLFEDEQEGGSAGSVSLRRTIGVNDKIILMRDLFGGNNEYYDRVITKLDSFDSLEDAMIYIHDNYHWNTQSEGARLLVELLARKLF
jgi:hypothetical protein